MEKYWTIFQDKFEPETLRHKETIFTIGNGYLCTRGAFEEGYPEDSRATFIHGVFDTAPIVFTELANAPDWLPVNIYLNGERFSLAQGTIHTFRQEMDLFTGVLTRKVYWESPSGLIARIEFKRFTSMADEHQLLIRCTITPEFDGSVEITASLKGDMDNQGLAHWYWEDQGINDDAVFLRNRTRQSGIKIGTSMRIMLEEGRLIQRDYWDVQNNPTVALRLEAKIREEIIFDKFVSIYTTRETKMPIEASLDSVKKISSWEDAYLSNSNAWSKIWQNSDVIIEGDDEAQISLRFNLFQMLIAAPRHDDRVNIGAKTLSGFGYRGHSFWDTEIFMLPLFIYTAPEIARNLLNYRFRNLTGARQKAKENGFEGAQFPWESADDGKEVTPSWVSDFYDRNKMVRIWTGNIEIHISADIAYAAYHYWKVTGDDQWLIDKGSEIILDTARFWASRAEWNADSGLYEYRDVIGPDEYHEHVDNNAMTNRMAQWNLAIAFDILDWLKRISPDKFTELKVGLDLSDKRLAHMEDVMHKIKLNIDSNGLIEQFDGFYQRKFIDLDAMEPRGESVQVIFGIEGANATQVIKQPDVVIMLYLLRSYYSDETVRTNYDFYTARTDHTYGSSLGPSIQAIMACEVGKQEEAYEHFIRAVRADLRDIRGNAGDGIHGASAAGTWQSIVFGFGGLHVSKDGWYSIPRLPKHWHRLAFKFFFHGELQEVDIRN
jgi:trehalose/maltose hydrolase-like predicted phosphorylase